MSLVGVHARSLRLTYSEVNHRLHTDNSQIASQPAIEKLMGALAGKLSLAPGESATVTFVVTGHFPNLALGGLGEVGRYYATRIDSASSVAPHVTENFERLDRQTRL